jgi:hypothetical protein
MNSTPYFLPPTNKSFCLFLQVVFSTPQFCCSLIDFFGLDALLVSHTRKLAIIDFICHFLNAVNGVCFIPQIVFGVITSLLHIDYDLGILG